MRSIYFSVFFVLQFLASCSDDSSKTMESNQESSSVRFTLVKITGQVKNSEATGDAMELQEYYELANEMKFEKVQIRDDEVKKSSGTFEITTINGDKYLRFMHETNNELIGNCTGDRVELLRYVDTNTLSSSWSACDGPGLFYEFD